MATDQDTEQQILATIDKWVEQELRPIVKEFDQVMNTRPNWWTDESPGLAPPSAAIRWPGPRQPTPGWLENLPVDGSSGIFNSHFIMANCVERGGTEAQKEYFLPKFASWELRGVLAYGTRCRV